MHDRISLIQHWLKAELGIDPGTLKPASSDASFRRYFRVMHDATTLIVMDAPPEHEDIHPFVRVARMLEGHAVHVPHIHASCPDRGLMLLEDLGNTPYLDRLNASTADALYADAMDTLQHMQACATDGLPLYDEALLQREMGLFDQWFLERHLDLTLTESERGMLARTYHQLTRSALNQPRVFVHRDYHSRNLMITERQSPGVIDFQDAVAGPITYDLASLLRDSYIEWPEERVMQWVRAFHHRLMGAGSSQKDWESFRKDFDLMSAQRHLKVAGIFARLNHRDGKPGYLKDIPLTLRNLTRSLLPYPEFEPFLLWLNHRVGLEETS
ncbi:MAG: phosphotransferase [Halothiobacillaceae bacterium]|nr:MAG: phosphotransferase [Halothiobacillaceae bacterium]